MQNRIVSSYYFLLNIILLVVGTYNFIIIFYIKHHMLSTFHVRFLSQKYSINIKCNINIVIINKSWIIHLLQQCQILIRSMIIPFTHFTAKFMFCFIAVQFPKNPPSQTRINWSLNYNYKFTNLKHE